MKKHLFYISLLLVMPMVSYGQSTTIYPNDAKFSKTLELNSVKNGTSGLRLSQLKGKTTTQPLFLTTTPTGIAINENYILVSELTTNHVLLNNEVNSTTETGFSNPYNIIKGVHQNQFFIANYGNGTLSKYEYGGISTYASGFNQPIGLALDNVGNLFVVNYNNGTPNAGYISKLDNAGNVVSSNFVTGLSNPRYCIFNTISGLIYVSNGYEIISFNPISGNKTTFKSGLGFCTGITCDEFGNLYVAQQDLNSIIKITLDGTVSTYATVNSPVPLVYDLGRMFVGDYFSGQIYEILVSEPYLTVDPSGIVRAATFQFLNKNNANIYGNGNNGNDGVFGKSNTGVGVHGETISGKAIYGKATDTGRGVYGESYVGTGIEGYAYAGIGVRGEANSFALLPSAGVAGYSTNGYGIYGQSNSGKAGYFYGNVEVTGSISKGSGSFKIDHPLDPANKYLYHSFVESPDMMNIYNGNITTDANGEATIQLPDYFEALNRDFRYQLTTVGSFARAMIAEKVRNNQFRIKTELPNVEVSWQVTGIRQDAFANTNRIPVVEEKKESEKGLYLYPSAFGYEKTKGLDYLKDKGIRDTLNPSDSLINKK